MEVKAFCLQHSMETTCPQFQFVCMSWSNHKNTCAQTIFIFLSFTRKSQVHVCMSCPTIKARFVFAQSTLSGRACYALQMILKLDTKECYPLMENLFGQSTPHFAPINLFLGIPRFLFAHNFHASQQKFSRREEKNAASRET